VVSRAYAFVAFDVLNVEGEDFRNLPLEVRRAELEALIEPDSAIMFSEALEDDGALVFAKACEFGVEGIVSKLLGAYIGCPSKWPRRTQISRRAGAVRLLVLASDC
jgi:bifunctional non-homologous end joining protein LigD